MTSAGEVVVAVDEKQNNTADENKQVEFKDGNEDDSKETSGVCGADMWYSPKGKSIPCVILLIVIWIIFLPLIIVVAFGFLLWYGLSRCYAYFFLTSLRNASVD